VSSLRVVSSWIKLSFTIVDIASLNKHNINYFPAHLRNEYRYRSTPRL
jgi:hypothetical protein